MDSSFSTPPPPSLNDQRDDSSPHFPLLDGRIYLRLVEILKKMNPVTLAIVRESSSIVNHLLTKEALKRNFFAQADRKDFMLQDQGTLTEYDFTSARVWFNQHTVQLFRCPAPFSRTSLLFHESDPDYTKSSYEFWKNHIMDISPATAMVHLAGSKIKSVAAQHIDDAKDIIAFANSYKLTAVNLMVIGCSLTAVAQIRARFQSETLTILTRDFQDDFQQGEQIAINQIDLDELALVHFETKLDKYPKRLVEHFLRSYQQRAQKPVLSRLVLNIPVEAYPHDLELGMSGYVLQLSYQDVSAGIDKKETMLLRSNSSPPRHVLFYGIFFTIEDNPTLVYTCISDADDLITEMFGSRCDPNRRNPSIADYSPSEIREIFNRPNWSA